MRFTFLGTGTSSGVPMIACSCAVCTSADPHDRRLRTGACLEFRDAEGQDRVVLIDCTPDIRVQALRAGLMRCDAVVFTHNHVDHIFGVDELRRFNAVQRSAIDIYADAHTMESLRRVYGHIFEAERNINQSFVATLVPHVIDAVTPLELFDVRFTPIPLLHGNLPILGFRIERSGANATASDGGFLPLAYCTDVSAIPVESFPLMRGVKTLVLDALRHRPHPTHFTVSQAVEAARRIGAEQTFFVHMTHDLSHAQTNAGLPERMRLSHDGLVLQD